MACFRHTTASQHARNTRFTGVRCRAPANRSQATCQLDDLKMSKTSGKQRKGPLSRSPCMLTRQRQFSIRTDHKKKSALTLPAAGEESPSRGLALEMSLLIYCQEFPTFTPGVLPCLLRWLLLSHKHNVKQTVESRCVCVDRLARQRTLHSNPRE